MTTLDGYGDYLLRIEHLLYSKPEKFPSTIPQITSLLTEMILQPKQNKHPTTLIEIRSKASAIMSLPRALPTQSDAKKGKQTWDAKSQPVHSTIAPSAQRETPPTR